MSDVSISGDWDAALGELLPAPEPAAPVHIQARALPPQQWAEIQDEVRARMAQRSASRWERFISRRP